MMQSESNAFSPAHAAGGFPPPGGGGFGGPPGAGGFGPPPGGVGFVGPPGGGGFGGPPGGGGFGGPPGGGGFGGPPGGGGFGPPPGGGGFGGPPGGGGFGPPPGGPGGFGPPPGGPGGFGPPPGGMMPPVGRSGRVVFAGRGGDLIVTYLMHVMIPMGAVLGVAFAGAAVAPAFDNPAAAFVISMPIALCLTVGIFWAALHGVVTLSRFHYENLTIEGQRCQYNGTVGGLVKTMWLDYVIMACTMGLYFPWYVTKLNKYEYSQVAVQSGEQLEFHGDPASLLGTYLIGAILMSLTGGLYFPWFANSMYEWRWNATSLGGRPFQFQKDPGGLLGTWLIQSLLTVCSGGIYAPWAICNMTEWEMRHVS